MSGPVDGGADELPADLDVTAYVGPYTFPDIRRRRVPGVLYLIVAAACLAVWATHSGDGHVLVNRGFLGAAVGLALIGLYHVAAAWPLAWEKTSKMDLALNEQPDFTKWVVGEGLLRERGRDPDRGPAPDRESSDQNPDSQPDNR